jgi:hypothetical protein
MLAKASIFDGLILDCNALLGFEYASAPSNFYAQVREIRHAARTSRRSDRGMLRRLKAELARLNGARKRRP